MALDSLYGAWLKAHHPLEYYTTLLSGYAAKGDKDRIALAKEEMQRGFGIRVVQYLAGHENSKITMDIYAKVKYNKPEQLSAVVDAAFVHSKTSREASEASDTSGTD